MDRRQQAIEHELRQEDRTCVAEDEQARSTRQLVLDWRTGRSRQTRETSSNCDRIHGTRTPLRWRCPRLRSTASAPPAAPLQTIKGNTGRLRPGECNATRCGGCNDCAQTSASARSWKRPDRRQADEATVSQLCSVSAGSTSLQLSRNRRRVHRGVSIKTRKSQSDNTNQRAASVRGNEIITNTHARICRHDQQACYQE